MPKSTCFIERDDGQIYAPLFATVRLHGVTDSKFDFSLTFLVNNLTMHGSRGGLGVATNFNCFATVRLHGATDSKFDFSLTFLMNNFPMRGSRGGGLGVATNFKCFATVRM